MNTLKKSIENDISLKCDANCNYDRKTAHLHYITVEDVVEATESLKYKKRDGTCELYSDHIIYASDQLYYFISVLFTSMIIHGTCPRMMLEGTMVPLPKVIGTNKSEKFRAITLGSLLRKIFDLDSNTSTKLLRKSQL
jgi:hypothetical protein